MSKLKADKVAELIENDWLGLGDTSLIKTPNVFFSQSLEDIEKPDVFLMKLLRDVRYVGWAAKHILNIELAPFQCVLLQKTWNKPSPMWVASRGSGKCVKGDTLIHTDNGVCEIRELIGDNVEMEKVPINASVLGEDGFQTIEYGWNNGKQKTRKITTRMGFELEGTLHHPIRVIRDGKIIWANLDSIQVGDTVPINRTKTWHIPKQTIEDDLAYLLGLIAGDGGLTVKTAIGFTTADPELLESAQQLSMRYWGKSFVDVPSSKYGYALYSAAIRRKLFDEYGFPSAVCSEKNIPKCVLTGSKFACVAFLQGLFDTDGGVENATVALSAKSEKLIKTTQYLLTRFGIISRIRPKFNKKYQRYYWILTITGQDIRLFLQNIGFRLKRKQKALESICNRKTNTNRDFVPHSLVLDSIRRLVKEKKERHQDWKIPSRFNNYHLKQYQITHETIDAAVVEFIDWSDSRDYQNIYSFTDRNVYFDTITSVANSECETYDVHVPSNNSFISNGFISHNSYLLSVLSLLKALFNPGEKIVLIGSTFRQSKGVFEYCETIWRNAPILRDIVGQGTRKYPNGPHKDTDQWVFRIGESTITALPLGTGQSIRGKRASTLITDEFGSLPVDVFETVVLGFAAVSLSPVERMKTYSRLQVMKKLGLPLGEDIKELFGANQTIIAGTAYYSFNHFFSYWKRYKAIIESRGDERKLREIFQGNIPENFNWRDYMIARLPAELVPTGYMDEKTLGRAKATMTKSAYLCEYGAVFPVDSDGFFRRSLVESCVVGKEEAPIIDTSGVINFNASLRGLPGRRYIMGVDPASEQDNFAITILEIQPTHRRIVYVWTTTRSGFKVRLQKNLTGEHNFYQFVAMKIRELKKRFPLELIAMDKQGGGIPVIEALADPSLLNMGEQPIYPVIDPDNPGPHDYMVGEHIVKLIQFAKADWVYEANHWMKADFEHKQLLFPSFDTALLATASFEDLQSKRVSRDDNGEIIKLHDTLEDCMMEIEELKDELASIIHSSTGITGRDKWDTPEVKLPGGKKGRQRKDRYSALLMANAEAHRLTLQTSSFADMYEHHGGPSHLVAQSKDKSRGGSMYTGTSTLVEKLNRINSMGTIVKRSK